VIIYRYLTKEVVLAFAATTFILLLFFVSEQFLSYMKSAAHGRLSLHAIVILLSLQVPVLLTILLPLSLFLGVLLGFGRLYTDNEMTILFACGVSRKMLFIVTTRVALGVSLLVALLAFYVAPKMEEYSAHVYQASEAEALDLLTYGRFSSVLKDKWVFYVEDVTKDHTHLKNVFAAQKPASEKPTWSVIFSKGGYQKTDASGNKFLVLTKGNRYAGLPGKLDYQIINFGEYGLQLGNDKAKFTFDENMQPTKNLWQNRHKPSFAAELHWRIAMPIAVFILTLLAVPLSKVNPRYGRYFSMVPAGLCFILYTNLMFVGRAWLMKGTVPLAFGMWWVHIIMLGGAVWLVINQVGWTRFKQQLKIS